LTVSPQSEDLRDLYREIFRKRQGELVERATGVEPATSSLGTIRTGVKQGSPRMKSLEPQGFSDLTLSLLTPRFPPISRQMS